MYLINWSLVTVSECFFFSTREGESSNLELRALLVNVSLMKFLAGVVGVIE